MSREMTLPKTPVTSLEDTPNVSLKRLGETPNW